MGGRVLFMGVPQGDIKVFLQVSLVYNYYRLQIMACFVCDEEKMENSPTNQALIFR
ncbi:hypothetical protein BSG1_05240 [Bacillus sp. SG-1]|nr:hypothetical protein BSG1_05240 [Bacillus sp. SG-1]